MITLKPSAGLKVRDCVTKELIPSSGVTVESVGGKPAHPYWQRLLRDGDVQMVDKSQTNTVTSNTSSSNSEKS